MEPLFPNESSLDEPLDSLEPLRLIKDEKLARNTRALYRFLINAHATGQHFTYSDLCYVLQRSSTSVRQWAKGYWSWFLQNEDPIGRKHAFSCRSALVSYPEFYFVMAHQRNQVQYYRHFYEAMKRVRDEVTGEQESLATTSQTFLPDVPGQSFPPELNFVDITEDPEEPASSGEDEEDTADTYSDVENEKEEKTPAQVTLTPTLSEYQGVYLEPRTQREEEMRDLEPKEIHMLQQEPLLNDPELPYDEEQSAPYVSVAEDPHLPEPEQESPLDNSDSPPDEKQPVQPINLSTTNSGEGIRTVLIIGIMLLILVVLAVIIWLINKWRG